MPKTYLSTDQAACGNVAPASVAAGGTVSFPTWIDVKQFRRGQVLLNVGAIAANGTVDAVLMQATTATGAGAKALYPAKSIATLTPATANGLVVLNWRDSDLDANATTAGVLTPYEFVNVVVTAGTAASTFGVTALGEPTATPPLPGVGGVVSAQVV